jgi:hypothetical protein
VTRRRTIFVATPLLSRSMSPHQRLARCESLVTALLPCICTDTLARSVRLQLDVLRSFTMELKTGSTSASVLDLLLVEEVVKGDHEGIVGWWRERERQWGIEMRTVRVCWPASVRSSCSSSAGQYILPSITLIRSIYDSLRPTLPSTPSRLSPRLPPYNYRSLPASPSPCSTPAARQKSATLCCTSGSIWEASPRRLDPSSPSSSDSWCPCGYRGSEAGSRVDWRAYRMVRSPTASWIESARCQSCVLVGLTGNVSFVKQ